MTDSLFRWMAEYNKTRNFDSLKKILLEETPVPKELQPLFMRKEGEENKIIRGVAIFANGDRLLKELIKREIVSENHISQPVPVRNKDELFDFLDNHIHEDGVAVYDRKNKEMAMVTLIKNSVMNVAHLFPKDTITYFGLKDVTERDIGNKTRLAVSITSLVTDSEAYLIKRSIFGPNPGTKPIYDKDNVDLGDGISHVKLGSVQLFKNGTIKQTLSFVRAPENGHIPFIDEDSKLVGILRNYEQTNGKPKRVSEEAISPDYFIK